MANYSDLDLQTLLDLLVEHTAKYTSMLSTRIYTVEEITLCKAALSDIHAAIEAKHGHEISEMKIIKPQGKEQPEAEE